MPALTSVSQTIRDPNLPIGSVPKSGALVIGLTKGTANVVSWYDTPDAALDAHIDGPALNVALKILQDVGGPVGLVGGTTSVAADNGAVTKVDAHTDPDVSLAGTARYDQFFELQITKTGALGVAKFRYNCDGFSGATDAQKTWSPEYLVPSGGDFTPPHSDLVVTFAAGTYNAGSEYTWQSDCAAMNPSDLATVFNAIAAENREYRFIVLVTSNNTGVASAHATLAATFQSELNSLANVGVNRRGIIAADMAADSSAVEAAWADVTHARLMALFGEVAASVAEPFPGYSRPRGNAVAAVAVRAAANDISTDMKRVRSGPLDVVEWWDDESKDATGLDDFHISTLRTWTGEAGVFIMQGRLKSAPGSDFDVWPRGIVMDVICDIVYNEELKFIGQGLRFNPGPEVADGKNAAGLVVGAMDPRDIKRLESIVNRRLRDAIMRPRNAEGTQGHATGVLYKIDSTHNIQSTKTTVSTVNGVPLVYPDHAQSTLGWYDSL